MHFIEESTGIIDTAFHNVTLFMFLVYTIFLPAVIFIANEVLKRAVNKNKTRIGILFIVPFVYYFTIAIVLIASTVIKDETHGHYSASGTIESIEASKQYANQENDDITLELVFENGDNAEITLPMLENLERITVGDDFALKSRTFKSDSIRAFIPIEELQYNINENALIYPDRYSDIYIQLIVDGELIE